MDDFTQEQERSIEAQDPRDTGFFRRWKQITFMSVVGILVVISIIVFFGILPVKFSGSGNGETVTVHVSRGQSFSGVALTLANAHLLRSRSAFEIAAFVSGTAFHMQSGTYHLSPSMPAWAILRTLSGGASAVAVVIPEGSNIYEIDKTLSDAGIIARGDLINFKGDGDLEGKLFPDTYQFYEGSDVSSVVEKFLDNFNAKAAPLFLADQKDEEQDLILASIVEKEAPDPHDESIIAGIMKKRMVNGMRLQIDATVCYAKQIALPADVVDCSKLTRADFSPDSSYDSAYNTYLHAGLPPGPIGNPGIAAITAVLHPVSSSYLYYVSDPTTGKIIYAATLTEQDANIKKYLGN